MQSREIVSCHTCGCRRYLTYLINGGEYLEVRCVGCGDNFLYGDGVRPKEIPKGVHEDLPAQVPAEETVNETRDRITEFMRNRIRE
jgi:hypothetical protein